MRGRGDGGGVHDRGVRGRGDMHGREACVADTTRYGQGAGGTHPTQMHSCFGMNLAYYSDAFALLFALALCKCTLKQA